MTAAATATLVIELLTEELPPKALKQLGQAFGELVYRRLADAAFVAETDEARQPWAWYATPRRLAVSIRNVRAVAPDSEVTSKLMPLSVAKAADGAPSEALRVAEQNAIFSIWENVSVVIADELEDAGILGAAALALGAIE